MSSLVVVGFGDRLQADQALLTLQSMERSYASDLNDACVVSYSSDGEIELKQSSQLTPSGIVGGDFWVSLLRTLFMSPLASILRGSNASAVAGTLNDIGVGADFLRRMGETIRPGGSALFILARTEMTDHMLADLAQFNGQVIETSLNRLANTITNGEK